MAKMSDLYNNIKDGCIIVSKGLIYIEDEDPISLNAFIVCGKDKEDLLRDLDDLTDKYDDPVSIPDGFYGDLGTIFNTYKEKAPKTDEEHISIAHAEYASQVDLDGAGSRFTSARWER